MQRHGKGPRAHGRQETQQGQGKQGRDQGGRWEQDERQRYGTYGQPWEEQGYGRSYGDDGMRGGEGYGYRDEADGMRADDDGMRSPEQARRRGGTGPVPRDGRGRDAWEEPGRQLGGYRGGFSGGYSGGYGSEPGYRGGRDEEWGYGGYRGDAREDRGSRGDVHADGGYGSSFGGYGSAAGGLGMGGFGASQRTGKGPKGYKRSDERIREDLCDRLERRGDWSEVEVSVADGEVTLSGTVADRRMKFEAEHIADSVSGVTEIHNQLRVRREGAAQGKDTGRDASREGMSAMDDDQLGSRKRSAGTHGTQSTKQ